MATMVDLDLAEIRAQQERRRARQDRAKASQKARAARPQPEPLPEGLEFRKVARAERAARTPDVRAARFEQATARISRAERIRRLEAEVMSLKAAAAKK
jgi:hypothetical protein